MTKLINFVFHCFSDLDAALRMFSFWIGSAAGDPMRMQSSAALAPFQTLEVSRFSFSGAKRQARSPCFSIYLLEEGRGQVQVDHALHEYEAPALLCLNPYQRAAFSAASSGWVLQFHASFFCIETHHHAVGCNGVLFNQVYEVPLVRLSSENVLEFGALMESMSMELKDLGIAHLEVLVASLKILLIKATRLKLLQQSHEALDATRQPEIVRRLREMLELHYQHEHRPSEYARMLGVSSRTLARIVNKHLHETLSELIRERVMKHAKWQLLHTLKPVKEVAFEVGFDDEFYFSRLFKRACGCSPMYYREHETALRGGSNLSR